jgi:L-histidine N-alpha-methyltransferase
MAVAAPATLLAPARVRVDVHLTPEDRARALRDDVLSGLRASPKSIPPKWFYDARGSRLFDAITRLPEYYPTRRERSILSRRAVEIAQLSRADTLVELGSGTSDKTRLLLDALAGRGRLCRVVALDVCEEAIRESGAAIAWEYPGVEVHGVVGDFERHLDRLPGGGRRLVVFLGSTLGNLERPARASLLASLRAALGAGETLLLGVDLVKDARRLVAAYDDEAGVTAAFNLNVLAVLNRELDGSFALHRFRHVARFDPDESRVEMWLRSRCDQVVSLRALGLEVGFARGEAILTEISTKFRRAGLEAEVAAAGFEPLRWWTDPAGDYAVCLSRTC